MVGNKVLSYKKVATYILLIMFLSTVSYIIVAFPVGTVTINTPVTIQNVSRNLTLDVTIGSLTGGTNVTNVTFQYDNGTGAMQDIGTNTTQNLTTYTFAWDTNTGSVGEGTNFTINVTALFFNHTAASVDADINSTSATVANVTIDNTAPTVTLNAPAATFITNSTTITFNFTPTDNIFTTIANCNLTLDPANASGGANINDTTLIASGTEVIFINTIPSGGHDWRASCVDNLDTFNQVNSTSRTINAGTTSSQVTIDTLDSADVSKTKFGATDTVTITCTRSDEDGYNLTVIAVQLPGKSTFTTQDTIINSPALNASNTVEFDFTDTNELGDYRAQCTVTDVAGNTNSSNKTFTIEKKVRGSTSAFSNKNFKPPVAKIKVNTGSISNVGRLTAEGFSRLMQQGAVVKFDIDGEEHSLKVKELEDEQVTVTISSTPFDVTVNEGEVKNVDVNEDGKSDMQVTFHNKFGKHADLTINLLSEEERQKEQEERKEMEQVVTTKKAKPSAAGSIVVTVIVVIVVVVIGYFLVKGKKK